MFGPREIVFEPATFRFQMQHFNTLLGMFTRNRKATFQNRLMRSTGIWNKTF